MRAVADAFLWTRSVWSARSLLPLSPRAPPPGSASKLDALHTLRELRGPVPRWWRGISTIADGWKSAGSATLQPDGTD